MGEAGVGPKKMAAAAKVLRGSRRVTSATSESTYKALDTYARDLVADAAAGAFSFSTLHCCSQDICLLEMI